MSCTCPTGAHEGDKPGSLYYVTVKDGDRSAFVAGPYASHGEAEVDVDLVRRLGEDLDPRSVWYAWGTARTDVGVYVGKQTLNEARDDARK